MAVVRTRSTPPYGLFAAVALAVLMTGAAVVFYLMWAKSTEEFKTANDTVAKAGSNADIAAYKNVNPSANTTSSYLSQANKQIAALQSDLRAAQLELAKVTADRDEAQRSKAEALAQAERATKEQGEAVKRANAAIAANDAKLTATNQQFASILNGQDQNNAAHKQAVADAQAALNKIMDDMEKLRRDTVIQREEDQSTIARLNSEIRDLRIRITNMGGRGVNTEVGEPDGTVVRVNGATGEVYINLTKKDHVVAGMSFTAYDPRTGVRYTSDDTALGNGSLEVIEVGETTSLCRITRSTKNRAIQAGDLIANLVYHNDKTRKFRFTVIGNFDLDGDGVYTAAERDRIILLIKGWGGQVDDDVSSQTDYLVVGAKPTMPTAFETAPAASEPAAGVTGSVGDVASKEQARYEDLIVSAKRLAIPVLNANRFLAMIGYYNTTVVRY